MYICTLLTVTSGAIDHVTSEFCHGSLKDDITKQGRKVGENKLVVGVAHGKYVSSSEAKDHMTSEIGYGRLNCEHKRTGSVAM